MSSHLSRRTGRLHHDFIALFLIAPLPACARQDKSPDAKPAPQSLPAGVAGPMANFARMVGGEWKMTAEAGTSLYDIWHWGPGKHSLRVMTDGLGADGNPWRQLEAVYWHPRRKQVCLLSLHCEVPGIGRGVFEGTIKFEGETADAVFDLYQPGASRKIARRWEFEGPDKYHATLLEATGPDGFKPLVAWDFFRIQKRAGTQSRTTEEPPSPAKHLKAFEALLNHTWEARGEASGDWGTGAALHIQSTFERIPYVEAVYVRTVALRTGGEPAHLLDAYVYHHVGTGALRCLALSNRGGVYEGDIAVLEGGALQLDLQGHEADQVVPHLVRLDFEQDGTVRHRVWSLDGAERTLMLDVQHKKLEPKKD